MHSPLRTQALAHFRDNSGPSPVRMMSRMPEIAARGSPPATAAGSLMGQASKHLPQVVQASTMASTRAVRAVAKVLLVIVHPGKCADLVSSFRDTPSRRHNIALCGQHKLTRTAAL